MCKMFVSRTEQLTSEQLTIATILLVCFSNARQRREIYFREPATQRGEGPQDAGGSAAQSPVPPSFSPKGLHFHLKPGILVVKQQHQKNSFCFASV